MVPYFLVKILFVFPQKYVSTFCCCFQERVVETGSGENWVAKMKQQILRLGTFEGVTNGQMDDGVLPLEISWLMFLGMFQSLFFSGPESRVTGLMW